MHDIKVHMMKFASILSLTCFLVVGYTAAGLAQVGPVAQDGEPANSQSNKVAEGRTVFGESLFNGDFANQDFVGFNPDYQVSVGDNIAIQLWGGFEFEGALSVDNQGNIFLPRVGPVKVLGVRNGDLNEHVTKAIQRTYKNNVGVYASLAGAEPVKIFVTGFVESPGLYAGHSSDSILRFLDLAGGIDPDRGSYTKLEILRNGELHQSVNLYDFLVRGQLPIFQLFDGDTILVKAVRNQVGALGLVRNAYTFEFDQSEVPLKDLLALARPSSKATHIRVNRNNREREEVDYYSLNSIDEVMLNAGDVVEVTSDKLPGTISVRVEGEHNSDQEYILPYGATLGEVLLKIDYAPNAQREAAQLFRISVKNRQKEMLMAQLRALESSVLTARSNTNEEAQLRTAEAQLIMQWVERAKSVETKGQVMLAGSPLVSDILLEAGDVIRIPRRSNLIMVHGDVLFPSAMVFDPDNTVESYIGMAGGFTQSARGAIVLVLRRDGSFIQISRSDLDSRRVGLAPGDEVFVLPRVQTKSVQIAKDFTSILYQIAVSAGVILRL